MIIKKSNFKKSRISKWEAKYHALCQGITNQEIIKNAELLVESAIKISSATNQSFHFVVNNMLTVTDLLSKKPRITNEMKAQYIGEFSWKEDAPYYDEDGNYIENEAERVVPWTLCKEIYKKMASGFKD